MCGVVTEGGGGGGAEEATMGTVSLAVSFLSRVCFSSARGILGLAAGGTVPVDSFVAAAAAAAAEDEEEDKEDAVLRELVAKSSRSFICERRAVLAIFKSVSENDPQCSSVPLDPSIA